MKRLFILALALTLVSTGCGSNRKHSDPDSDGMIEADTASLDSDGGAEVAPAPVADADATKGGDPLPLIQDNSAKAENLSPPVAGTGQMANYTVQKGDTLMKIAFSLYGDIRHWKNIFELNKDVIKKSANQLTAGLQLKYDKPAADPAVEKNGDPYLIKKGDTLGTIADDVYAKKTMWKKIFENNRTLIRDPNRIYAGFYLYYQISEEEKRAAEAIKAKRGGAIMGAAEAQPDSAAVATPLMKGGGLSKLLGKQTSSDRKPASVKSK